MAAGPRTRTVSPEPSVLASHAGQGVPEKRSDGREEVHSKAPSRESSPASQFAGFTTDGRAPEFNGALEKSVIVQPLPHVEEARLRVERNLRPVTPPVAPAPHAVLIEDDAETRKAIKDNEALDTKNLQEYVEGLHKRLDAGDPAWRHRIRDLPDLSTSIEDGLETIGSWLVPYCPTSNYSDWSLEDELIDGLESEGRAPSGLTLSELTNGLLTVESVVEQFYPDIDITEFAAVRLGSASAFHQYVGNLGDLDDPQMCSQADRSRYLLASQITNLRKRFAASRLDSDFGDFHTIWSTPSLYVTTIWGQEGPQWRETDDRSAKTLTNTEAAVLHRTHLKARRNHVDRLIKVTEELVINLKGAAAGKIDFKTYDSTGNWSDAVKSDRTQIPTAAHVECRKRFAEIFRFGADHPGKVAEAIAVFESDIPALKAEACFLDWLLTFEDPIGELARCHYEFNGLAPPPWHRVLASAGFGAHLPRGRPWTRRDITSFNESQLLVEDLAARLLCPDGESLINRLELVSKKWGDIPRNRTGNFKIPQNLEFSEDRNRPIIQVGYEPKPVVRLSIAQRKLLFESADGICPPAFGSCSHPDFEFQPGTIVILPPGEPAYILGEGWTVVPGGRLVFEHGELKNSNWYPPFATTIHPITSRIADGYLGGPRVAYYRGRRYVRDVDFYRDECVGERLWRIRRNELTLFDALRLGIDFEQAAKGNPDLVGGRADTLEGFTSAFQAGLHPFARGIDPKVALNMSDALVVWPWLTLQLPPAALSFPDRSVFRPNVMDHIQEQLSASSAGPCQREVQKFDALTSTTVEYRSNQWNRIFQSKPRVIRSDLDYALRQPNRALDMAYLKYDIFRSAIGALANVYDSDGAIQRRVDGRNISHLGYGHTELDPGSRAFADSQGFLEYLETSAERYREVMTAAQAEQHEQYERAIGASFDAWDQGQSQKEGINKLDARNDLSEKRRNYAEMMAKHKVRIAYIPDPARDGAGAQIEPVNWSGTYRPAIEIEQAKRTDCLAANNLAKDVITDQEITLNPVLIEQVLNASGPWKNRSFMVDHEDADRVEKFWVTPSEKAYGYEWRDQMVREEEDQPNAAELKLTLKNRDPW